MPICKGLKADGQRCSRQASQYCWQHGNPSQTKGYRRTQHGGVLPTVEDQINELKAMGMAKPERLAVFLKDIGPNYDTLIKHHYVMNCTWGTQMDDLINLAYFLAPIYSGAYLNEALVSLENEPGRSPPQRLKAGMEDYYAVGKPKGLEAFRIAYDIIS